MEFPFCAGNNFQKGGLSINTWQCPSNTGNGEDVHLVHVMICCHLQRYLLVWELEKWLWNEYWKPWKWLQLATFSNVGIVWNEFWLCCECYISYMDYYQHGSLIYLYLLSPAWLRFILLHVLQPPSFVPTLWHDPSGYFPSEQRRKIIASSSLINHLHPVKTPVRDYNNMNPCEREQ